MHEISKDAIQNLALGSYFIFLISKLFHCEVGFVCVR